MLKLEERCWSKSQCGEEVFEIAPSFKNSLRIIFNSCQPLTGRHGVLGEGFRGWGKHVPSVAIPT